MRLAKPRGLLFIIGGGEDKEGDCAILGEFVRMVGGENSRIVVMTAATDLPEELGAEYSRTFKRLGVDTTTKTMPALLAKAKGLNEEGLTACLWSGGYNVPPSTLMSSVREDILSSRK